MITNFEFDLRVGKEKKTGKKVTLRPCASLTPFNFHMEGTSSLFGIAQVVVISTTK